MFDLQMCSWIQFRTNTFEKGMQPLISPAIGSIVSLLFFFKNVWGIK